ncbi:MAG: hypothetical protein ACFFAS_18465 [Promethearchaeota archaeon]
MSLNISQNTINQSLDFIGDLNLNEEDFEALYELFKCFFKEGDVQDLIKELLTNEIKSSLDFKDMLNKMSSSKNLSILSLLVQKLAKHEDLINDVQDILLEKLI